MQSITSQLKKRLPWEWAWALVVGGVVGIGGARLRPPSPLLSSAPRALVFEHVTVIDVQTGQRFINQRVVIVGNRIQHMGPQDAVGMPPGAQVIEARGQYLIPGLWDMHSHTAKNPRWDQLEPDAQFPLFIAMGITGFRDAGSGIPIDTLRQWQREILAGKRVGPPHQILSGQSLGNERVPLPCVRSSPEYRIDAQTCVTDSADVRHLVDSTAAAGADMIKPRALTRAMYFVVAAEARKLGIPFGGHIDHETPLEAADSGAAIVDHSSGMGDACWGKDATVSACAAVGTSFRAHHTWLVATLLENDVGPRYAPILKAYHATIRAWCAGHPREGNWLRDSARVAAARQTRPTLEVMHEVGIPFLAGTDATRQGAIGALQTELTLEVAEGLTPLEALQTATLNPAVFWHATDSLGTVASGKLADLVLLDGDPLTDITNVTRIRAVVANGRYYDREALDQLLHQAYTVYTTVFGDSVMHALSML